MSRAAVHTLLSTDATLQGLGYASSAVVASNAIDDPPDKFIVVHWDDMPRSFSRERSFGPQTVTIWVHDRDRNYDDVNAALARVKTLLHGVVHLAGGDGWTITQCDWRGDSGDLWDDGYRTVVRTTSFEVISRPS